MAVCGTKTYPDEYGAYSLMANLKKDIIFGTVFTAVSERIVGTNTVYKKMKAATPEAGVKKQTSDKQLGSIVNGLQAIGVWDADTITSLAQSTGNYGAKAIATIATYISERFAQGMQIKLDEMWIDLQKASYGYYNCMACGYILGFILRHYVNSEFSWNRGDNNPWPFTEKNIAIMINDMCNGKTVNHYLSADSEIWQQFKPYVQKVFKLSDGEAVNETEARKYMSKQCTENAGVPFWALKYLSEDKFGGTAAKSSADAVQAIGHIKINVHELGIDFLSASAHKFNGPKGIGFLYIRKGIDLIPYADGGAQETGHRAGTENVASIVGMAAALKKNCEKLDSNIEHVREIENILLQEMTAMQIPYVRNGGANMLPGILSLSFKDHDGEAILHRMDLLGISVSTGSACDSVNTEISHVLKAIGLDESLAKGTIRISLGKNNSVSDVKKIAVVLKRIIG